MQTRTLSPVLVMLFAFTCFSCNSSYQIRNTGEVDLSWAGEWKGKALLDNSLEAPKTLELDVVFTSTNIKAFLTDSTQKVYRYPVKKLLFTKNEISFQVGFETPRGLRSVIAFRGKRNGPHLMINFAGSEGGRPFRGKWQARLFDAPPIHHTQQRADTTSKTSL